MTVEAGLDLTVILTLGGALILALLALYLVKALAGVVSFIPYLGNLAEQALYGAIVNPLEGVASGLERRVTSALSQLVDDVAVFLAIPLLLGYGVYKALDYAWHSAIKPLVAAAKAAALQAASRAQALAKTAETDASKALSQIKALSAHGYAVVWNAIRDNVAHSVSVGVAQAEKYASTAVHQVEAAPGEAAAKIGAIATTAEHDLAHAFAQALGAAEGLAIPVGGDITALEKYVKGLGIAGLAAAVPGLAYLVQSLVHEAGLTNPQCRDNVKGICGTDPAQWASLLEGLVAVGVAFDLQAIVTAAEDLAKPVEALLKQAA